MKVLDLFAGLRGWSDPWRWSGHQTFTIDLDSRFRVDAYLDIRDVAGVIRALPWKPDVILASPPCAGFTTMNIGKNWYHDGRPKTFTAVILLRHPGTSADIAVREFRTLAHLSLMEYPRHRSSRPIRRRTSQVSLLHSMARLIHASPPRPSISSMA